MASIRFAGLVFGVIIVSLALMYSSACAQEGSERKEKWLPPIPSSQNDLRDDIFAAAVAVAVANVSGRQGLGGRKMRIHELLKREIDKKQGSNERREISGATCSARPCYSLGGKTSLNKKHSPSDATNYVPKKLYVVGFVASTADYHPYPRHHPPKNN